jgi:hypothetical protein
MSEAFLENPIYVYMVLALALIALAAVWYERRSRRVLAVMLVPVVLAAVVAVLDWAVVTDREKIEAAADKIAEAISSHQYEQMLPYIDRDFTARVPLLGVRMDRSDVVAACKAQVARHQVSSIATGKVEVTLSGRDATMVARTMVHWSAQGAQKMPMVWTIRWIRRPDGWKVLEVVDLRQGI